MRRGSACTSPSTAPCRRTVWLLLRASLGLWKGDPDLEASELEKVTIHSKNRRLRVANDGELLTLETPLHYSIRPKALTVLVPKQTRGMTRIALIADLHFGSVPPQLAEQLTRDLGRLRAGSHHRRGRPHHAVDAHRIRRRQELAGGA